MESEYVPGEIWRCIFSSCSAFCQVVSDPSSELGTETEQEVKKCEQK